MGASPRLIPNPRANDGQADQPDFLLASQDSHAVRYWLGQEVTVKGVVTRVNDDGVDEARIYVTVGGHGFWLSVCSDNLVGRTGRVID